MSQQPALSRRRGVRREILEDDVDAERGLDADFDLAEKGDKVLRPMLAFAACDDGLCKTAR
jgi:hypothetical protein